MRSWPALLVVALSGCSLIFPPPEPHPVFIAIRPGTVVLPQVTYLAPPQTVSFELENTGADTLFISVLPPAEDALSTEAGDTDGFGEPVRPDNTNGSDWVRVNMTPHTMLLPGQRELVEVTLDPRSWRWVTGSYTPTLTLSAGYFFSGQDASEPETVSLTKPPRWIATPYDLFVSFEIDCDLDDDGEDSTECGGADCMDDLATVFQGAQETCNGLDDDCDGAVDEDPNDAISWYLDFDRDGFGDPESTQVACFRPDVNWLTDDTDCDDTRDYVHPRAPEVCDGRDSDCDGAIDQGCP